MPIGLSDALQPLLPEQATGMVLELQEAWLSIGGEVDWPQVEEQFQLRAVTSRNHQVAILGQCIGTAAPSGEECGRCRRSAGCFASCRVVGYTDGSGKGVVVSLGSCMCCHFAGVAQRCSLRADSPAWALAALRGFVPGYQYPAVTPTAPTPSSPLTPARSVASRIINSVSNRLSRKRPRTSTSTSLPLRPRDSESAEVESPPEGVQEGVLSTPVWRSVLTRELFEASPDVRLQMEVRLQAEVAQLQVNLGLVRRDIRGLESLRGQEAVDRASSGGEVDAVWADHVADL